MKEALTEIAKAAGKLLLEKFRNPEFSGIAEIKGSFDYSIKMDRLVEGKIIQMLKDKGIECNLITEESGEVDLGESEYTIYLDPLDGTLNYAHSIPHYAVSIGVEKGNRLFMAVIYDPNSDELFFAERDEGAFLNGKRIHVSRTSDLNYSILNMFGRTLKVNPEMSDIHVNLMKSAYIRMPMSAVLALAYTACGRTDATIGTGHRKWDVAAGALLVKEAGGTITEINGDEFNLDSKSLLASNPHIHRKLLEMLVLE